MKLPCAKNETCETATDDLSYECDRDTGRLGTR